MDEMAPALVGLERGEIGDRLLEGVFVGAQLPEEVECSLSEPGLTWRETSRPTLHQGLAVDRSCSARGEDAGGDCPPEIPGLCELAGAADGRNAEHPLSAQHREVAVGETGLPEIADGPRVGGRLVQQAGGLLGQPIERHRLPLCPEVPALLEQTVLLRASLPDRARQLRSGIGDGMRRRRGAWLRGRWWLGGCRLSGSDERRRVRFVRRGNLAEAVEDVVGDGVGIKLPGVEAKVLFEDAGHVAVVDPDQEEAVVGLVQDEGADSPPFHTGPLLSSIVPPEEGHDEPRAAVDVLEKVVGVRAGEVRHMVAVEEHLLAAKTGGEAVGDGGYQRELLGGVAKGNLEVGHGISARGAATMAVEQGRRKPVVHGGEGRSATGAPSLVFAVAGAAALMACLEG
jgi:hypothetical protein